MAWLENAGTTLSPLVYRSILALAIALLTDGLTWGIRPAFKYFLSRIGSTWSGLVATLCQGLILLVGIALIVRTAGVSMLLVLAGLGLFFFAGIVVGGETLVADYIATLRIRRRQLFRVGDTVTLGNAYRGLVTKVGNTNTHVNIPGEATVMMRNSHVLRNPIVVHEPSTTIRSEFSQLGVAEAVADTTVETAAKCDSQVMESVTEQPVQMALASEKGEDAECIDSRHRIGPDAPVLDSNAGVATAPPSQQMLEAPAQHPPVQSNRIRSPNATELKKRTILGKQRINKLREKG